jgi:PKD repeat protein
LHLGENEINLTVKNLGEGYTLGFEILHGPNSETIWFSECGEVGVYGCNNNEQTGEKIVYDKKIILELEEREFSAFTFVQLTDVHIGCDVIKELYYILHPFHETEEEREESRKKEYEESYERFTAALNSINDLDPKPAFILVTGDHVEWNDPKFFMGFKSAISSFAGHNNMPFYFIPGNHDRRKYIFLLDDNLENYHKYIETPWYEYPEFKEISEDNYLIKQDNFFFEWENYIFIALDSGRDWFDGTLTDLLEMLQKGEAPKGTGLTEEQINKLRSLERAKRKIIFMHHPAINYKVEGCIEHYRDKFIEYCNDPENNVEVVLTGHTHQDGVYNADLIYRGSNWVLWHPPLLYDRPLFVQTRSATKSGLGLYPCFPGYRVIGVGETSTCGISYTTPEFVPVIKAVTTGPINLHAYNSKGEHTGFGSAEVNIPKSFYTGNYNGTAPAMPQMIILYNTSDDYIFKVTPNLESSNLTKQTQNSEKNESFNLTVEKQTNDSLTTISYQNISITRNTTAKVSFNQTTTNYTMEIDTDGDGEIDEYKVPNSTETNYAPTATIISPGNNSIFIHGDEITFYGTGTDPEEGVLRNSSLVWSSDIYGIIGVGNEFDTFNLSAGTHKITLMVNDSAGLRGMDYIEITVNAPDLTLNSSDITFANPNPTEGEIISINVTVHNIGFVNATNVTVHIIDGFREFQISNLTVNTIPTGENRTVNESWDTTGKMGNHTISVMIDPSDMIEEMNEMDNEASRFIVVKQNVPPIAKFTYSPEKPVVNQTITFNASNSTDPDGNITKYDWDFGDGNITNTTNDIINHSYSLIGNYTVNLTVMDSYGATNSSLQQIKVTLKAPPEITAYAPESAVNDTEGATRTFNVTIDQPVNVSWQINGTEVQTNYSVIEASYTNLSAVVGTWNVSAIVNNANGTDMQTWVWAVTSPCFIATAAYGTALHEDINVLRDFRDEYLMPNPVGRTFVKIYYTTSPPLADVIRDNEGLRTAVREGLVKPLVHITRMFV